MTEELKDVFEEGEGDLWTPAEFEEILNILAHFDPHGHAEEADDDSSRDGIAFENFSTISDSISWSEVISRVQTCHVTTKPLVVKLEGSWEAAQPPNRNELDNAAVGSLSRFAVPERLNVLWQKILSGSNVQVIAPVSFWKTAFSRPFLSVGLCDPASNKAANYSMCQRSEAIYMQTYIHTYIYIYIYI